MLFVGVALADVAVVAGVVAGVAAAAAFDATFNRTWFTVHRYSLFVLEIEASH